MDVEIIDLGIIVIFFIGLLIVGYISGRNLKGSDDFAFARGRLRFPVLLGTLVASTVGASATIGRAGKAYEVGMTISLTALAYAVGLLAFAFIAPILRRQQLFSIPKVMGKRYGAPSRVVSSIVLIVTTIVLYSAQLIAVGLVGVALLGPLGVDYQTVVIVGAAIITAYTLMGGMMAVAVTDVVQAVIVFVSLGIILPFYIIDDLGGAAMAIDLLKPQEGAFLGGLSPWFLIAVALVDIPICLIDPSLWQKAAGAQSEKDLRRAVLATAFTFFIWSGFAACLGVWSAYLIPGLQETLGSDAALPQLVATYMPPIIRGICFAALMAIMMSTADTALLIAGTTFSLDLLKVSRPNTDDRTLLKTTRWVIIIIGGCAPVIALSMQGIFEVLLFSFAIFVVAMFAPVMAAIFWSRASQVGAMTSAIAAIITLAVAQVMRMDGALPTWMEPIILALIVSCVLMISISYMTTRNGLHSTRLIDLDPEDIAS